MTLEEAHDVAEQLEAAIRAAVPEVDAVQTHLEPLTEAVRGRGGRRATRAAVERIVREATGRRAARGALPATDAGLVAFLTLGLDARLEPRRRPRACERDRGAHPRRGARRSPTSSSTPSRSP